MIPVIQCAATKRSDAGMWRAVDGAPVIFVADPGRAPPAGRVRYARPDDRSDSGSTWRDEVRAYNDAPGNNPLNLLPACELYERTIYRELAERAGRKRTYILSAGWGLISASFLTPLYDITFSASADAYKRRGKGDRYADFCMLPESADEPILFFGGKDYVPLFCRLTRPIKAKKYVFYNSAKRPETPGCSPFRFETSTRTNWHYECARAFLDGSLMKIPDLR